VGWTSTRGLTVKKGQVILQYFRRSYEFCSSFCPPIESVKFRDRRWGNSTTVNFKKEWSYTTTLDIYIYGVMPDKHKEIYITSYHIQSISVRTVKANVIYAKLNGNFLEKCKEKEFVKISCTVLCYEVCLEMLVKSQ